MRTTYDVRRDRRRRRRRLAARPRPAHPGAAVHRPGRRGGERQPAGADAGHGRPGRRGGRATGSRPGRPVLVLEAMKMQHTVSAPRRRHGHRDRREGRRAGRRRRGPGSGGGSMNDVSASPRSVRSCAARWRSWRRSYGREWFTDKARSGGKTTELWLEIAKNGYLGINIPEEYGGGGGGIGDIAAVCEELAAQGCPLLLMVVSPAICGTIINRYGTEEQKRAGCPASATAPGRWRSRSPSPTPAPTPTTSPPRPAATVTSGCSSGRKIWISGVDEADHVLVVARTEDAQDRQAQALPVRGADGRRRLRVPGRSRWRSSRRRSSSRCSSTTSGCPRTRWSATRTAGWCSSSRG